MLRVCEREREGKRANGREAEEDCVRGEGNALLQRIRGGGMHEEIRKKLEREESEVAEGRAVGPRATASERM